MKVVPSEVTVMLYFLNLRNDWNRKILEGTGNVAASWWNREKRIIISVFVIIFEGSYVESSKKSSACMFNVHQYRETSWKLECQLCLILRDSMDHSPPGSSVCGILQARIPEWVAISSSMGYSRARDWTHISFITGRLLTVWAAGEAPWWTLNTLFTLAYKFFSSVPLLNHVRLCDPMDYNTPGFPIHHQLPELAQTHVHWVSDAIQLSHPLLLLPSVFPSIRVFSNESVLHIRWPKYWSFSFSISPSSEYSGLISFRIDWLD